MGGCAQSSKPFVPTLDTKSCHGRHALLHDSQTYQNQTKGLGGKDLSLEKFCFLAERKIALHSANVTSHFFHRRLLQRRKVSTMLAKKQNLLKVVDAAPINTKTMEAFLSTSH
eukprot:TRINITY_DN6836_c0_g1_i1.p1 TRINITY_DN6836_c0_g1~~TRINITY_DN6836_c0_g1_i1.p1  ORF type:complete len:113 (+),score=5.19 TRINITY_DN6836_c0_g1_i1:130-468(+)